MNKKLKKEIIIRSIKIIDIGYIIAIYLILGVLGAKLCDKYLGVFDEDKEEKRPLYKSIIELILYFWFLGVVIYIVRNVIPLIPFPLDGIYGFDHLKVKEVTSGATFTFAFLYFQVYYQKKIKYIFSKLDKNKNINDSS
jgi:hypothetical protein